MKLPGSPTNGDLQWRGRAANSRVADDAEAILSVIVESSDYEKFGKKGRRRGGRQRALLVLLVILLVPIAFFISRRFVARKSTTSYHANELTVRDALVTEVTNAEYVPFDDASNAFSIVLPTLNGMPLLKQSVESVIAQDYDLWELIVVDDGTTDEESLQYLSTLPSLDKRIRLVRAHKNGGLPNALNIGLELVRGDLLSWTSDDNAYLPNFLSTFKSFVREYPEGGMYLSTCFHEILGSGEEPAERIQYGRDSFYGAYWPLVRWDGLASFVWRKSLTKYVGFFDTGLMGAEDWDYWIRITSLVSVNPRLLEPLYVYRRHNKSLSIVQRERVWEQSRQTVRKHWWFLSPESPRLLKVDAAKFVESIFPAIRFCFDVDRCRAAGWLHLAQVLGIKQGWIARTFEHRLSAKLAVGFARLFLVDDPLDSNENLELNVAVEYSYAILCGRLGMWHESIASASSVFSERLVRIAAHMQGVDLERLNSLSAERSMTMARTMKVLTGSKVPSEFSRVSERFSRVYAGVTLEKIGCSRPYRLAVIPSGPLDSFVGEMAHGRSPRDFFNPLGFFDEVYCFSPKETEERLEWGMRIIPTSGLELQQRLVDFGIDVVRTYGADDSCEYAVSQRLDTVPVVCSVHESNPERIHESVAEADFVLPVSSSIGRACHEKGAPAARILSFRSGVDFEVFRPLEHNDTLEFRDSFAARYPGRFRIVHVSQKSSPKSWDTLLKAIEILGADWCGLFVGTGNGKAFREYATKLGIGNRVFFEQKLEITELRKYYSLADVVYTPSMSGGFAFETVQALASGAAVVSSGSAPWNEIVVDGFNGVIVQDHENAASLAAGIRSAVLDKELNLRIRENSRQSVSSFSVEVVMRWEVELYRMALHSSSRKNC